MRPLAISGAVRANPLSDVPTFKEQGYDLEYYFGVGLSAPKGRPDSGVAKLREAINTAAHSQEFLGTLDKLGQELPSMEELEFAKFWVTDAKKMEDADQFDRTRARLGCIYPREVPDGALIT